MNISLGYRISNTAARLLYATSAHGSKEEMDAAARAALLSARILLSGIGSVVCLLIIGAPLLSALGHSIPAAAIYFLFAGSCHQIPQRSFTFLGHPWAVCSRCAGIYLGILLAAAVELPRAGWRFRPSRTSVIAGIMPLLLDALLPMAGVWNSSSFTRFLSGMIFGITACSLALLGVAELLKGAARRRFGIRIIIFKEGAS